MAWPERPSGIHFHDETYKIQAEKIQELETTLNRVSVEHMCDVRVGVFNSLEGRDLANTGYELVRDWEMGKGFSEGRYLLLAIFLKERKMRLEYGTAFDGTDLPRYMENILSAVIAPRLKKKDYAGGVIEGFTAFQRAIEGKYLPEKPSDPINWPFWLTVIVVILAFIFGGNYYGGYGGSFFDSSGSGGFGGGGFGGGGYSGGGGGCSGSW